MSFNDLFSRYDGLQEAFELSLTIGGSDSDHAEKLISYLDMALNEAIRIISTLEPTNEEEARLKIRPLKNPRASAVFSESKQSELLQDAERSLKYCQKKRVK